MYRSIDTIRDLRFDWGRATLWQRAGSRIHRIPRRCPRPPSFLAARTLL